MKLLVDIGNTRIKWAMHDDRGVGPMSAASYADWDRASFERVFGSLPRPEAVWVANVAGDAIAQLISDGVFGTWGLNANFVQSTAFAADVRSGYAIAEQLGVDRWLGVIGA